MPGDPGELVVTNACAYYTSRTRLRVQRAPGIPRSPLGVALTPSLGGSDDAQLGRFVPRDGEVVCGIKATSFRVRCFASPRNDRGRRIASLTLAMTDAGAARSRQNAEYTPSITKQSAV